MPTTSVETHQHHHYRVRVTVDGVDVTDRCYEADTDRGIARCFAVNAEGKKYAVWGPDGQRMAAQEDLFGVVVVTWSDGTPLTAQDWEPQPWIRERSA